MAPAGGVGGGAPGPTPGRCSHALALSGEAAAPSRSTWPGSLSKRLEYEEIIGQHLGSDVASDVRDALERYPNVQPVRRYYRWNLIEADPDDNKFVDSAVAGNADCLVTNDRHFDVLERIGYPCVTVVTPEAFKILLADAS